MRNIEKTIEEINMTLSMIVSNNAKDKGKLKSMKENYLVLDLFSGPGGHLEGFLNEDFKPLAHIEMNKYASMTLETRLAFHKLLENEETETYFEYLNSEITRSKLIEKTERLDKYIKERTILSEISFNSISTLKNKITRFLKYKEKGKIDVILGGPPCQSYSIVGRSRDPNKMKNDSRNYLYRLYLNFVKHYKPNVFVFENVPGILSAKNNSIIKDFEETCDKIGYVTQYKILDSSDFLVLQKRRRVILLGWKKKSKLEYPEFNKKNHSYQVFDLLNDLPSLEPEEGKDGPSEYSTPSSKYLLETGIRNNKDLLIQHRSRYHNKIDREIYRRVIEKWNDERKRLKYDELPEKLIKHNNKKSFLDRFKVVAGDLPFSHSIVAHISKDGHYYIHPNIIQARSLTVREAARIQSFPDNYKFEGPRTSQFTQVGNAVPPLMARDLAKAVKSMLEEI